MCPLRPYLVHSSTGANHRTSSGESPPNHQNHNKNEEERSAEKKKKRRTRVVEHVLDDGSALVDLVGIAGENDLLDHHAVGVHGEERADGHQPQRVHGLGRRRETKVLVDLLEHEHRRGRHPMVTETCEHHGMHMALVRCVALQCVWCVCVCVCGRT